VAISSRILGFLACISAVLPAPTFAETITVGGVGSLSPLVRKLADDYGKKNPGVDIVVVHPPLGTRGGMRALASGKIDILLSGRELKPDEAAQSTPWVQTPLVLATNRGKTSGFSRAQLADVYAWRKNTWDDNNPIRLVLRGDQETETRDLRAMSPEIDAAVGTALKRGDLPIAENDLDALDSLTRIPGSFGTTSLGLLTASDSKLVVVPIDGVKPSIKVVEDGSYRWLRHYHLGVAKAPRPAATAFYSWLKSPPAIDAARKLDYLPIKP
jgi:phosphate transport system substrate-binding protein